MRVVASRGLLPKTRAGAGGGGDEAEEDFDGGGFAGAVGAEEGDDFAGAEGEVEAVEGSGGAVVLGDVGEGGDGLLREGRGVGWSDFGLEGDGAERHDSLSFCGLQGEIMGWFGWRR